jgi:MFS family permease
LEQGKISYFAIAPCLLAIVVDALGFGLVYPVMTALLSANNSPVLPVDVSLSVRHFYLGLSFMLYPFCMFFGTSFMGDLSDNYGRKKVLIVCMGGIAISFFMMAVGVKLSSMALLLLGRALSGLMAGSQPIAQAAIADMSTTEVKAKNMSIIALSYCVGSILGPVLGGVTSDQAISSYFNFATPFFISGVLALCAVIWLSVSFKETFITNTNSTLQLSRPIRIFVEAFAHRTLRSLAIIFLLMQVGFSIYFQFIVVHMKYAYQYNNWQLGAVQGMLGFGFALGLLVGMPLALKYWKTWQIAVVTLLLIGVGQIFAAVMNVALIQWILAVFIATVDIMAFTTMLTLFSDAADKNAQGWAMGIANAVMALSWALTGLFSNLLELIGTQGLIFLGGICLLLSSLLLGRSSHIKKSTHEQCGILDRKLD